MAWVGKSLRRKEDDRLIRGRGQFADDEHDEGMLHLYILRSPYAHARVLSVDASAAEALPGVACVITPDDVKANCDPYMQLGPEPCDKIVDLPLATDKAVYQGHPVAAVAATSPALAMDAGQLIEVEYDMLDAVVDTEEALEGSTILHEEMGTNRTFNDVWEYGDVDQAFTDAAHVVKIDRLHCHRFSAAPLEANACVAEWTRQDELHLNCNNSFAGFAVQLLAPGLRLPVENIHISTRDVGGSFGIKIGNYPYYALAALASRKAGWRKVKWHETRSEHLLSAGHSNERTYRDTEVALDKDGVITAIRSRHIDDCGAYPRYEPLGCVIWTQVLPATFKVRNMRIEFNQVMTNKCPTIPVRGYSRLQQLWFMERVLDICGHELGIPTDEMRLRNYIREFPYETPNGCVYDSGDYPKMLEMAKDLIGWDEWKRKQEEARKEGRWMGIGIGTTLDSGTNNFGQAQIMNPHLPFSGNSEVCNIRIDFDGAVVVTLGTGPSGQGHETTTAQVVADELNIDPSMVRVRTGFDTDWSTFSGHSGTYASQFAVTGLSAVHGACQKLKKEMKQLAAQVLEANENDLEFSVGDEGPQVGVRGTDAALNYWYMSNLVNSNNAGLGEALADVTLNVRHVYRPPFQVPDTKRKFGNLTLTYAAQLHIAVVEIDKETYHPKILAYSAIDDCGNVINPQIAHGQVHGATCHGLGAALMETFDYDEGGNLLTSTFSDYCPITALNMPDIEYGNIESPSPFSYNGAKGMGEGGGAPLHTISAALQDALHAEGVIITESHHSPPKLFERLQNRGDKGVHVESR
ncbi:xanthine dehydrogenase family protein molybdopterin-binding subunit [Elongatibacter sediminis]|uniref:Xanthine dehydrogenase family protein molybdopterin-binding subunit n=1 Tax=Elongatibacter sediminis TaxID=3119006 RepID=A0AAW9RC82_9GAMM